MKGDFEESFEDFEESANQRTLLIEYLEWLNICREVVQSTMNPIDDSAVSVESDSACHTESSEHDANSEGSMENKENKQSRFEQMHPNLKVVIPPPSDQSSNAWPADLVNISKDVNNSHGSFQVCRSHYSYQQNQTDFAPGTPIPHSCFSSVYDPITPDRSKAPPPYAPQALGVVPYVARSGTTGSSTMTPNAPPFEMIVRVEQERRLLSSESIDKLDYFKKASRCKAVVAVAAFAMAIVLFAIFVVLLVKLS